MNIKTHEIDMDSKLKLLRRINVYGETHLFDENDAIFQLSEPASGNP